MEAVLVGYGEVGRGLYEVFKPYHNIIRHDPAVGFTARGRFGVMLVALPYTDSFAEQVVQYKEEYKPKITIIFSTVPVGTCRALGCVHSPIEGVHPQLAESIKAHTRWVGGNNSYATAFFLFAMLKVKVVDQPDFTEFLKLRSLAVYSLNIEFARYSKKTSDSLNMDYDLVPSYDRDYNYLNTALGNPKFSRYVLYPPEGDIGGHCLLPGVKLLINQYYSPLLAEILKNNEND